MNFINFTNHPLSTWDEAQVQAAEVYGEIKELPFPSIEPEIGEAEIAALADMVVEKILAMNPAAVLCQGEFTLSYAVITRLKKHGIKVLAASSARMVDVTDDGKKIVRFHFERFREYV
ncbi:MAG: hypothetical protein Q4F21_14270 [Lachnospiraceae bacterium]|nr:hypothetical protein [Lachnospiraceae bacterium]